jgi:hypothetical protein
MFDVFRQVFCEFFWIAEIVGVGVESSCGISAFGHEPRCRIRESLPMRDVAGLGSLLYPPFLCFRFAPVILLVVGGVKSGAKRGFVALIRSDAAIDSCGAIGVVGPGSGHRRTLSHERVAIGDIRCIAPAYVVSSHIEIEPVAAENALVEIRTELFAVLQGFLIGLRIAA